MANQVFVTSALILAPAGGELPAGNGATALEPVECATLQVITRNDSSSVITEKVAKVLPRADQTAWFRLERTFSVHFGVNTFNWMNWEAGVRTRSSPGMGAVVHPADSATQSFAM
jgi:alpha-L-fucosidase